MSNLLTLSNVSKSFAQGQGELEILKSVNLQIKAGEVVALVGKSGSGKTTLLQIAGMLANATSGEVELRGQSVAHLNEKQMTQLRANALGFVYQFHHLLPEFSAIENVILPQLVVGVNADMARDKAANLLKEFGLASRETHRPSQLSGGEMQRVAIARALANDPALLLADEPTGNLDDATSESVFQLLMQAVNERNMAALIATHNKELALRMGRSVVLDKGVLV